jgi:hypothetical protein
MATSRAIRAKYGSERFAAYIVLIAAAGHELDSVLKSRPFL